MTVLNITLPDGFLNEEIRNGYTITRQMKEVWAVELDLLNELMKVCAEHSIELLGVGGTMLGAARHGGFIPWDDDIDLMMTRENYIKLCECASTAFAYPYFFQTEKSDNGTLRGHAQLRNCETTAILMTEKDKRFTFNQGIFIDIFPLDNVPDDAKEREAFFRKLQRRKRLARRFASLSSRYTKHANRGKKGAVINILGPVIAPLNRVFPVSEWLYQRYEKLAMRYNKKQTSQMGLTPLAARMEQVIWHRTDIESGIVYLDFEFMKIPVPANYKNMLDWQFGNWHEFVVGKSQHGTVLFDTEKSYKEYLV